MNPNVPGHAGDAVTRLYATLHRYAGWLDRERASVLVRADVQALGIAIDTRADPMALLQLLDANIGRLPSSEVRKLLRVAARDLRRALS